MDSRFFFDGWMPSCSRGELSNDLRPENLTFGWFQFETVFSEAVENNTHPFQVFFLGMGEHYYII